MANFFTSDTHFNHGNIIKYCNRPFSNEKEMDETIITNWNRTVGNDDDVYVLGDFVFKKSSKEYLSRLNGRKHLIRGNHDYNVKLDDGWTTINELYEIVLHNKKIVMCHYPMVSWNCSFHGSWQLYGHVHGRYTDDTKLMYDVGVDCNNFTPVSFWEIKQKMDLKIQSDNQI